MPKGTAPMALNRLTSSSGRASLWKYRQIPRKAGDQSCWSLVTTCGVITTTTSVPCWWGLAVSLAQRDANRDLAATETGASRRPDPARRSPGLFRAKVWCAAILVGCGQLQAVRATQQTTWELLNRPSLTQDGQISGRAAEACRRTFDARNIITCFADNALVSPDYQVQPKLGGKQSDIGEWAM